MEPAGQHVYRLPVVFGDADKGLLGQSGEVGRLAILVSRQLDKLFEASLVALVPLVVQVLLRRAAEWLPDEADHLRRREESGIGGIGKVAGKHLEPAVPERPHQSPLGSVTIIPINGPLYDFAGNGRIPAVIQRHTVLPEALRQRYPEAAPCCFGDVYE